MGLSDDQEYFGDALLQEAEESHVDLNEKVCTLQPGSGCAGRSEGGAATGPPSRQGVEACQHNCKKRADCVAAFTFRGLCLAMSACPLKPLSTALAAAQLFTCEEQPEEVVSAVGDPHITSISGAKRDLSEALVQVNEKVCTLSPGNGCAGRSEGGAA